MHPILRLRLAARALTALGLLLLTPGTGAAGAPSGSLDDRAAPLRAGASAFDGLWEGLLLIEPGAVEVEFAVELARGPSGRWSGTYDQPAAGIRYRPFDAVEVEGDRLRLELTHVIPEPDLRFEYVWTGSLGPDGRTIEGARTEGEGEPTPFVLRWLGPPGTERPAPAEAPVVPLSAGAGELRDRFNEDAGAVRLVALLSPSCSACLAGAGVVQRYVLDQVPSPSVRVYVVWGPMLGHEREEDAGPATTRVPDPRARHFWTGDDALARAFEPLLGLPAEATAWDTYLLFPPGASWDEGLPAPGSFMHLRRGFPEDRRLDGEALAREVQALLDGGR